MLRVDPGKTEVNQRRRLELLQYRSVLNVAGPELFEQCDRFGIRHHSSMPLAAQNPKNQNRFQGETSFIGVATFKSWMPFSPHPFFVRSSRGEGEDHVLFHQKYGFFVP